MLWGVFTLLNVITIVSVCLVQQITISYTHYIWFIFFFLKKYRKVRTVELPKTLQDLYEMGSRPEGHICELRCPPNCKNVHGFIEIPTILEKLFFHEFVSGIPKRELINYHLGAKVQFSVDKREKGFYAKDLYVKV